MVFKSLSKYKTEAEEAKVAVEKGEEAGKFLGKSFFEQLGTKEFRERVPGVAVKTLTEVLLGKPAKFLASIKEAPGIFMQRLKGEPVKAEQREYELPGLDPFKSYISEAETRAKQITEEAVEPEKIPEIFGIKIPWQARAMVPFVEVPLVAIETVALAKGIAKIPSKAKKVPSLFKKGVESTKAFIKESGKVKKIKNVLQTLQPKRTAREVRELANKGSLTTTGKGPLRKTILRPSKKDIEVASDTLDIISPKKPLAQNIEDLNEAIVKVSQETEDFLNKNPKKIYKKVLEKQLDKIKPAEWIKTEKSIHNSYNSAKGWVVRQLKAKGAMTNLDLWNFRKELDIGFQNQFGSKAWNFESANAAKKAYLQQRQIINEFITKGTQVTGDFADNMSLLHNYYLAKESLSTWAPAVYGKTGWEIFWKTHPVWAKGIKGAAVVAGGAWGLGKLFRGD